MLNLQRPGLQKLLWLATLALLATVAIADALADTPSSDGILHIKSAYNVERTVERAKRILEHEGFRVFGVIDHQKNAKDNAKNNGKNNGKQPELSLPPTQLLVFGAVENGTALMNENRLIGIDLPLKLLVWQDDKHIVWISYTDPEFLSKRHKMRAQYKKFENMKRLLQSIGMEAAR